MWSLGNTFHLLTLLFFFRMGGRPGQVSRYTLEGVQLLNHHLEYTFRIKEVPILKDGVEKSLFGGFFFFLFFSLFLILTNSLSSLHKFSIKPSFNMRVWKAK